MALCVIGLMAFCGYQFLLSSGIVGQTLKPGVGSFVINGCFCHSDSLDSSVRVWIEGPDSLQSGTEGLYTVSVYKDSNIAAGFDVAAFFGEMGIVDSIGTQLMTYNPGADSLEVTHTQPKFATSDTISWQFKYRAPTTPGIVDTLYSVSNSVNADGGPGPEDRWNFGENFLVYVTGATAVKPQANLAGSFSLYQNFPNPFNPSTTISFDMPVSSDIELTVYDIEGREVETVATGRYQAGFHVVQFNANGLASGIYFYRLLVNDHSSMKKMVLLR